MKQLNPDRLRSNLHTVVNDVEKILHNLSDVTGTGGEGMTSRAGHKLNGARNRLGQVERQTAAQLRRASRQTQGFVREHPWQLAGGLAAIAVAVAVLARTRH